MLLSPSGLFTLKIIFILNQWAFFICFGWQTASYLISTLFTFWVSCYVLNNILPVSVFNCCFCTLPCLRCRFHRIRCLQMKDLLSTVWMETKLFQFPPVAFLDSTFEVYTRESDKIRLLQLISLLGMNNGSKLLTTDHSNICLYL